MKPAPSQLRPFESASESTSGLRWSQTPGFRILTLPSPPLPPQPLPLVTLHKNEICVQRVFSSSLSCSLVFAAWSCREALRFCANANANASNALDRFACSSPAARNTCMHTRGCPPARTPHPHWLPPLLSARPPPWCRQPLGSTGSLPFTDWLLAALAVDADAIPFFSPSPGKETV